MVGDKELDRKVLNDTVDNQTGNTPLMFAAIENNISFMERLVALGCSVNKKNKEQVKEPPHKIIHLKVYD